MLGIDDTTQQCVVGDQATFRSIHGERHRTVADVPSSRLLWARRLSLCIGVPEGHLPYFVGDIGSLAHL